MPVVLAGDYNVVPTPQDIYQTRSLDNNALIQPETRRAFARLLAYCVRFANSSDIFADVDDLQRAA